MAQIVQRPKVDIGATFLLNESELRAMDALVGYGVDGFLKVFYAQMGEAYMKPNEAGIRSLFKSFRDTVPGILDRADAARKAFEEAQ